MSFNLFRCLCNTHRSYSFRRFTVLAFESSADDTCAAIVNSSRQILSNVVIKQHNVHEEYGGIHPMVAIEAHQRNMPLAVRRAVADAGVDIVKDIDGIAFTRGPGIGGCLSVGSNAAKSLAAALNKPIVGVHHMQAHALTAMLTSWPNPPSFPFLTLLISGGHTLLLLAKSPTSFQTLATTQDESIGRSFDKVAKILRLKWTSLGPGATLEQFCKEGDVVVPHDMPPFPNPMPRKLAFSYASLHSHAERFVYSRGGIESVDESNKRGLALSFQTAASAQLERKLSLALDWCKQNGVAVEHIVVSGGVASNTFIRTQLESCVKQRGNDNPISLVFPPPSLCTDNAVMIGWASMDRFLKGDHDEYTIDLRPKWDIETLYN